MSVAAPYPHLPVRAALSVSPSTCLPETGDCEGAHHAIRVDLGLPLERCDICSCIVN